MAARRTSRGSGVIALTVSSHGKKKTSLKPDQSENEFSENDLGSNRLSGAFEVGNSNKGIVASKAKLGGSLFAAKVFDEPRRRNTSNLLPMKKTKSVPVKISQQKLVLPPPAPESEFDNMADMFGTSPIVKPNLVANSRANAAPVFDKSPIKKKTLPEPGKKSEPKEHPLTKAVVTKPEPIKKVVEKSHEEHETLEYRFEDLQRRFEQLSMLRSTNAEALLENYKKAAKTRDHASEKLIESLKHENALLKERFEAQAKSRRDSGISVMSVASNGASQNEAMMQLYRNLSGLQMTPIEDSKWSCTIEGRHGTYSFELEYDVDEGEYTYTPVFTSESTVWERLPGYLKEEIVFGEGYLQSFFWRALNFLMSQ